MKVSQSVTQRDVVAHMFARGRGAVYRPDMRVLLSQLSNVTGVSTHSAR